MWRICYSEGKWERKFLRSIKYEIVLDCKDYVEIECYCIEGKIIPLLSTS